MTVTAPCPIKVPLCFKIPILREKPLILRCVDPTALTASPGLDDPRDLSAPPTDCSDARPLQNGSLEQDDDDELKNEDGHTQKHRSVEEQGKLEEEKQRQKKKYTRLSRLRRRRCARKDGQGEDESDLSEGFESEDDEDDEEEGRGGADSTDGTASGTPVNPSAVRKNAKGDPLAEEGSWGSGSEEEEEGGTAFDVETDSDMNSQESRSDLEDMEDAENLDKEGQAREQLDEDEDQAKEEAAERDGDTPPATNGPLMPSDSSISSNLQAMSSQLFQAKRCFRLAPTFSNMLLRPQASSASGIPTPTDASAPPSQETPPPPLGDSPCSMNPATANGTNDNGNMSFTCSGEVSVRLGRCYSYSSYLGSDSDSEGSQHSTRSVQSEKTLLEKLEILSNQGLIQVVKVFVDWLRTNTDIIVMCAQVRFADSRPSVCADVSGIFFTSRSPCSLCRVRKACGTACLCCSTCCQMAARCSRLVRF